MKPSKPLEEPGDDVGVVATVWKDEANMWHMQRKGSTMSESGYLKFDEVARFKMDAHHADQGSQFTATRSEGTSGISIKVWDADSRRAWDRFVKVMEAIRAIGG